MPWCLFLFLYKCYEDLHLKVKFPKQIFVIRRERQECALALLLFSVNINPFVAKMNKLSNHPLKLKDRHTAISVCVDDAVVLSQTPIDLMRALHILAAYCRTEALEINYAKLRH